MKLTDLLPLTKPMDRIKRINEDWKSKYVIVNDKYESLYLLMHRSHDLFCATYVPTFEELLASDWDFMK